MNGFREYFASFTGGKPPFQYQERVADLLWARKNVLLRAPTGAGKTLAVLAPFLFDRAAIGAARLIYALPLRSLALGIYDEARRLAGDSLTVKLQTGEQPDDPFFSIGDIVVTTYDQVLSGLLCAPYGLSPRLNNINAAALVGNVVVFDEFHLMETTRAFLTAVAGLRLFGSAARSIWMTATATSPLGFLILKSYRL